MATPPASAPFLQRILDLARVERATATAIQRLAGLFRGQRSRPDSHLRDPAVKVEDPAVKIEPADTELYALAYLMLFALSIVRL